VEKFVEDDGVVLEIYHGGCQEEHGDHDEEVG
jgi:hypothetical protein